MKVSPAAIYFFCRKIATLFAGAFMIIEKAV